MLQAVDLRHRQSLGRMIGFLIVDVPEGALHANED